MGGGMLRVDVVTLSLTLSSGGGGGGGGGGSGGGGGGGGGDGGGEGRTAVLGNSLNVRAYYDEGSKSEGVL